MELKDKTILITGGASGIGFELATELIKMKNMVIVTGRDEKKLALAKSRLPNLITIQNDVSDLKDISRLFEQVIREFPKLDMLVNNAGEMRTIVLKNNGNDLADLTREIDINLKGPIHMIQTFLPHLLKQASPAILNVSSGLAFVAFPISPIYGASKSGLHSYTQALRVQLNHTDVRVFELVAPAADTSLNDKFLKVDGFDPKLMMKPNNLISATIKAIESDKYEILPGSSKIIKFLSRLAPGFILKQTSKAGAKMMYSDTKTV